MVHSQNCDKMLLYKQLVFLHQAVPNFHITKQASIANKTSLFLLAILNTFLNENLKVVFLMSWTSQRDSTIEYSYNQ